MGFEGGRRYLQIARRETEPPKFGRKRTFQPGFWARLFLSARWKLTLDPSSAGNVWLQTEEYIGLSCFGISTVTVSKALLWHTVEIRSKDRTDCLSGLNADTAQQLADDVVRFINVHLATAVFADKDRLGEISARIHAITHGNLHYLAHSDISKAIASVPGDAAQALSHPLFDGDLLPATLKAHLPASLAMLTDPAARHRYNENFVAHELGKFEAFFDDLGGVSLSAEQREACIRLEDSNLLVASAGSGKSATMVGKVAYALKKGLYDPSEILVLAFNKKAADQLKARLGQQLSVDESALGCRIATFHALGLHIIKEVTGRPPQLANWVDHPTGEAKQIEKIIQELKHSNPEFRQLWIELLTIFPKADLPVEVFGSKEDYYRYINDRAEGRASTIGTLADVYVKSLQEQRIANWLWLNSVEFEYERQISIPEGEAVRYVHPDFYYPQTQTIHEHFALNADGTSPFENYVQHTQSKREGYRKGELDFFETSSAQASDGTLLDHLTAELGNPEDTKGFTLGRK